MKNIFLNGLNNIAPTELITPYIPISYYYFAPTEQNVGLENQFF